MVCTDERRTERSKEQEENPNKAATLVEDRNSARQSAKRYEVNRMTLTRYISRKKKGLDTSRHKVNQQRFQVFTQAQEQDLCNHVRELADKFYGVTTSTCRSLV